ncbi:MAG: alanine racemase C-terminal domain-containing protein [Terrimesophilobacter sp.]
MTRPSDPAVPGTTGLLREARLSRAALDSNLSTLVSGQDLDSIVVDVRADGYGHGLVAMVAAAVDHGILKFRISPGITLAAGLTEVTDEGDSESELAAYGFTARAHQPAPNPVLSLVGGVVAVKTVPAQSGVSYGYTYRTEVASRLALVGLGYADGLPRLGSNRAHAMIGGEPVVVAGRIAMDQFVLDLGDRVASVGDSVTVWGAAASGAASLTEWSRVSRRSPADLTTGLGSRIHRRWIEKAESE